VRAGSRLHFGLLAPGAGAPRRFGGAGLMVERPGITLRVERAERSEAGGPLAERALEYARRLTGREAPPLCIEVEKAPPGHVGLGTGTQLALAVARAISLLAGEKPSAAELASRLGRGRRSAIGIHGFELGGFIVDGGKTEAGGIAPLVARHPVPERWRILLVIPPGGAGLSGAGEEEAFRRLEETAPLAMEALCRTLLLGLLPALVDGDFPAFSEALHDYGRHAGEGFQEVQGGAFMSPVVADLVHFFRREGIRGTGQSSWGPAVYAFFEDEERARAVAARLEKNPCSRGAEVILTLPLNRGAAVEAAGAPSLHTLA
jgi:beta-RFAP synthase